MLANLAERVVIGTVTISYLQSADGRFAAVFQALRLRGGFFFFDSIQWDLSTEQTLGSCTTTADDTLTQQIERARAEWLVAPEVPPEPIGNPGTQQ